MSEFWYTKSTMDKLNPDYLRFEHFSLLHLSITAAFILIIIAAIIFYKKLDENGNQCYEITITGSIVVPINYDVSYYKYEIFDEICDTLANKKMEEKMESEYLRDIE